MDESELPEREKQGQKSKPERYAEMGWDPLKEPKGLENVITEAPNSNDSNTETKTESPDASKNKIEFPVYLVEKKPTVKKALSDEEMDYQLKRWTKAKNCLVDKEMEIFDDVQNKSKKYISLIKLLNGYLQSIGINPELSKELTDFFEEHFKLYSEYEKIHQKFDVFNSFHAELNDILEMSEENELFLNKKIEENYNRLSEITLRESEYFNEKGISVMNKIIRNDLLKQGYEWIDNKIENKNEANTKKAELLDRVKNYVNDYLRRSKSVLDDSIAKEHLVLDVHHDEFAFSEWNKNFEDIKNKINEYFETYKINDNNASKVQELPAAPKEPKLDVHEPPDYIR